MRSSSAEAPLETSKEFQDWFMGQVRAAMPTQREEQAGIPIHVMPNGDTAGARVQPSKR
jgi:glucokinase